MGMRPLLLLALVVLLTAEDADSKAEAKAEAKAQREYYAALAVPDPAWRKVEVAEFPESMRGVWWRRLPGSDVISEDRRVDRSMVSPLRAQHFAVKDIAAYYKGESLVMVTYTRADAMALKYTDVISDDGRIAEIWKFGSNVNCDVYVIK